MMRPIRDPNLNPRAPAFKPGEPWKGAAPKRPELKLSIPEREPASPSKSHSSRSDSPPRSQDEWEQLSQNLRQHQSLAVPSPVERPGRPLNPLRPPHEARADAKQVETDMAEKEKTKSDMGMFFDGDIPHEPAGKRAPTPGETAVLKDFDQRRRAFRDDETGEGFRDLRNRGEYGATYDIRGSADGKGKTARTREFHFDRGNTSRMDESGAIPPHMRVHSHPDFTLPFPSPQDHKVAAHNFAAHGEKNYLVTDSGKAYQFGPGKNGPEYTKLSPVDLNTPVEGKGE